MRITVAGAGIAGLAVASFLTSDGRDVTVCYQFPAPCPVGSGMVVQPVGLSVLRALGLDQALVPRAILITRVFGCNAAGRKVLDMRYRDLRPDTHPSGVQRSALFALLLRAATDAGANVVPSTTILGLGGTAARLALRTETVRRRPGIW